MPLKSSLSRSISFYSLSCRFLVRVMIFSAAWSLLTGSDTASWILGAPAVLIAAAISLVLSPAWNLRVSPAGAFFFIPYFLNQSVRSGLDVMRRTFAPVLRVNPGLLSYPTYLPEGPARVLFANTISLLPGTLSVDFHEDAVIVHSIDTDIPVAAALHDLETRIAGIFRIESPGGRVG